jgi:hypothetical protein
VVKKNFLGIVLILSCFSVEMYPKIRLLSIQYNRPDFIEMQQKCLTKFLKDDYELIVVSDAVNPVCKCQIEQTCERLGIACVNFPQELHYEGVLIDYLRTYTWWPGLEHGKEGTNCSVRHCQLVRYALENFGYNHDDIIGIMEGDVFLIRDFSIRDAMKDYDFLCSLQSDVHGKGVRYIWIGLFFVDLHKIPNPRSLNFDIACINGVFLDSGGSTYNYLKANPSLRIKKSKIVPLLSLCRTAQEKLIELGYSEDETYLLTQLGKIPLDKRHILLPEFHFETHFLHQSQSRYSGKTDPISNLFRNFLNRILE